MGATCLRFLLGSFDLLMVALVELEKWHFVYSLIDLCPLVNENVSESGEWLFSGKRLGKAQQGRD